MKFVETADGVVLIVYVKPNAKRFQIILNDELLVLCRESPVKGKVNKELLKEFSRLFKRKVELISGFTSRKKKFNISNIKKEEVKRILVSNFHNR
jgi:uncharacterized protein (TIGR00251 family)